MISYAEKKRREGKAEGKAEGLVEALLWQLERKFHLSPAELEQVRAVEDTAKLLSALDAIIESGATRESVLEKLR